MVAYGLVEVDILDCWGRERPGWVSSDTLLAEQNFAVGALGIRLETKQSFLGILVEAEAVKYDMLPAEELSLVHNSGPALVHIAAAVVVTAETAEPVLVPDKDTVVLFQATALCHSTC